MKHKLSRNLQPIYDLELAHGNSVVRVADSGQPAFPLAVIFRNPLNRKRIESILTIVPPVRWYSVGDFGGYVSEDSRQSLQGPMPDAAEVGPDARKKLSPELQPIYDLELALGNTVVEVDEPAGSLCPLAIVFKNPLHRSEVESTLGRLSNVTWWESHDPHYPIEGGYKCDETDHVVVGPLR